MTLYVVVWLAYSCPGGPLSFLIPQKARPLVCEPEMRMETTAYQIVAEQKIQDLGPEVYSGMFKVVGSKPNKMRFSWSKELKWR